MEREYNTYLFEYFHEDSFWVIPISASSEDDAKARMQRLPYARLLGIARGKIPATIGSGALVRLLCWWKNLHLFDKKT